ncbi:MAG: hypothetical protein ACOYOP_15550 [Microthrixaceae bacterium]
MSDTPVEPADLWAEVVGQERASGDLRAAADQPVHAYLLVGPEGSGKRAAARAFAADLLERAAGDDPATRARARHLVAAGRHPALFEVEREGASIRRQQAEEVVRLAGMSPPEGALQVLVLHDFHLVSDAGPVLLKSLEEPHDQTVFLVLAEELPPELVTIASRCVTVEFTAVAEGAIRERLEAEGVEPEQAAAAAASAGGSLSRARLLAGDPEVLVRHGLWRSVPDRLDGSGATACALVDEVLDAVAGVQEPLRERQEAELEAVEALEEQLGERRAGDRTALAARHKRELRRVLTDELRAGLATMVARYRSDVVAGADGAPERFATAAQLVQELLDGWAFNPNEAVQLRALFVRLPRPVG